MSAEHLSTALFRETRGGGFFRVLSGRNAPFYVDVLDSLERKFPLTYSGYSVEFPLFYAGFTAFLELLFSGYTGDCFRQDRWQGDAGGC